MQDFLLSQFCTDWKVGKSYQIKRRYSIWPNGWVFIYELSGCEFESSCSHNKYYSKTSGSLWNYRRDERTSGVGGANNNINYSMNDLKAFNYKTSTTRT